MKLVSSDNSDLMEVNRVRVENSNLIVVGTIMGAMPIEAIVTPAELRSALKLLNVRIVYRLVGMLFSR